MAKFTYRMQNILEIKLKLEAQAKIRYAAANAKLQEEQDKLQVLLLRRVGYERKLRELMTGELDIREVNHMRNSVQTMQTLIRAQTTEIHKAELAVEAARKELNEIMQERKAQEKLRQHPFEEFKQELMVQEN